MTENSKLEEQLKQAQQKSQNVFNDLNNIKQKSKKLEEKLQDLMIDMKKEEWNIPRNDADDQYIDFDQKDDWHHEIYLRKIPRKYHQKILQNDWTKNHYMVIPINNTQLNRIQGDFQISANLEKLNDQYDAMNNKNDGWTYEWVYLGDADMDIICFTGMSRFALVEVRHGMMILYNGSSKQKPETRILSHTETKKVIWVEISLNNIRMKIRIWRLSKIVQEVVGRNLIMIKLRKYYNTISVDDLFAEEQKDQDLLMTKNGKVYTNNNISYKCNVYNAQNVDKEESKSWRRKTHVVQSSDNQRVHVANLSAGKIYFVCIPCWEYRGQLFVITELMIADAVNSKYQYKDCKTYGAAFIHLSACHGNGCANYAKQNDLEKIHKGDDRFHIEWVPTSEIIDGHWGHIKHILKAKSRLNKDKKKITYEDVFYNRKINAVDKFWKKQVKQ
eukprot:218199_1